MSQWPKDIDVSRSADTVFESLGHRPEVVVWIAACLEHGSTEQLQMALHLDRQLLRQFVVNLQLGGTGPSGYLKPLMARDEYFSRLAMILCREGHPTNYVRAKLNPALFAFVQTIEMQRGDFGHGYYALTSGICILILGLNVALNSSNSFPAHRVGVAVDYTHWFGRLARSEVANNLSVAHPSLIGDMEFAVASILKASETFGASVEEAIARVVNDPLVSSGIKITLRGSPQR
jgi:hypothetical protein